MQKIGGIARKVQEALDSCDLVPLAEIGELQALHDDIVHGGAKCPQAVAVDDPVHLAGFWFFRPTIAMLHYLDKFSEWLNERDADLLAGVLLCHARDAQWLRQMTRDKLPGEIEQFREGFAATPEELVMMVDAAMADFPRVVPTREALANKKSQLGQNLDALGLVARMMSEYGQKGDYWLFDVSLQAVVWMCTATVGSYTEAGAAPSPNSPLTTAQRVFMARRNELIAKYGANK